MRNPRGRTDRWESIGRAVRSSWGIALALVAIGSPIPSPAEAGGPSPGAAAQLVVCAPGYPGSTMEAQPAMDRLAGALATAAGWSPGSLVASYDADEAAGLARLRAPSVGLALVPLNFWLEHRAEFDLRPELQAVPVGGDANQRWSLVAAKGVAPAPESLAGFELVSLAGNTPRFVRGPALAHWGALPKDLEIRFSGSILSALRRAAAGEKVALLLDAAQTAALSTLPSASKLETLTTSPPLPTSVLCAVGGRLPASKLRQIIGAAQQLEQSAAGAEALAGVRLTRFVVADAAGFERAASSYAAAAP